MERRTGEYKPQVMCRRHGAAPPGGFEDPGRQGRLGCSVAGYTQTFFPNLESAEVSAPLVLWEAQGYTNWPPFPGRKPPGPHSISGFGAVSDRVIKAGPKWAVQEQGRGGGVGWAE